MSADGRRLSKRDRDMDLGELQKHRTSRDIVGELAFLCGMLPEFQPVTPAELIPLFSWEKVRSENLFVAHQ